VILSLKVRKIPQMIKTKTINQQDFDKLLNWLDLDRELAGQKYESIRFHLIKIFKLRGSHTPEELADETIDRVTKKIDTVIATHLENPAIYFYGVGKKIFLEQSRLPKTEELSPLIPHQETEDFIEETQDYKCLKICLQSLKEEKRILIIEYYRENKRAKIENRRLLAQKMGVTHEFLRIQTHRIRTKLQKCIKKCLEKV
jgi:DNA-directed RNA polymerase specialized sigma24 family protein